jgi:rod shape-determining protein MreD
MSFIAGSKGDVVRREYRRRFIPVASTIAASLLAALPIVAKSPLVPEFSLLVVIAWRLLRPEIWPAHMALPLGLFNDLVAGHPLGQSMALWTITFLAFDMMDTRLVWRDYLIDWLAASLAILFYTMGGWYVGRLMGSQIHFLIMLPQIGLSILAFPVVARIVLTLDRWRLSR